MKVHQKKFLIVYEDDNKELASLAQALDKRLRDSNEVKLRSAAGFSIPELLAADCYAFLFADGRSACWSELRRICRGINLAGRKACLASQGDSAGARDFAAYLAASDLHVGQTRACTDQAVVDWFAALPEA